MIQGTKETINIFNLKFDPENPRALIELLGVTDETKILEYIDNAMDTLLNLSGSNKLVGVISHREELIENIPQQIKVSKGKEGSRVTIETGI
ncbi:MAG: hypothetical protein J6P45_05115 [Lachnospiraceae bacterium]|nr:hypothetical protein [Lachnospiraceae bacterium]